MSAKQLYCSNWEIGKKIDSTIKKSKVKYFTYFSLKQSVSDLKKHVKNLPLQDNSWAARNLISNDYHFLGYGNDAAEFNTITTALNSQLDCLQRSSFPALKQHTSQDFPKNITSHLANLLTIKRQLKEDFDKKDPFSIVGMSSEPEYRKKHKMLHQGVSAENFAYIINNYSLLSARWMELSPQVCLIAHGKKDRKLGAYLKGGARRVHVTSFEVHQYYLLFNNTGKFTESKIAPSDLQLPKLFQKYVKKECDRLKSIVSLCKKSLKSKGINHTNLTSAINTVSSFFKNKQLHEKAFEETIKELENSFKELEKFYDQLKNANV